MPAPRIVQVSSILMAVCLGATTLLRGQVPFHSPSTPSPASATKSYGERNTTPSQDEAVLVDWRFLDHTGVKVSDGARDAVIKYPPEIRALDNQRIAIVGFMAPWEQINDMTKCMIMPGYVGCYFCNPPAVTQVILVEQHNPKKKHLPYINEAVIVTGTLRLFTFESKHPAHQADFMYALDDAQIEVFTGKNQPKRAVVHTAK